MIWTVLKNFRCFHAAAALTHAHALLVCYNS